MPDPISEQKYSYDASLRDALPLVEEALDILDLAEAPDQIGAYLDMARHSLESCLSLSPEG